MPINREIARLTSFEDCIVSGCRLEYGHAGKHDFCAQPTRTPGVLVDPEDRYLPLETLATRKGAA